MWCIPLSEDCTLLAFSPKLLCIFISNRNVPRIIFSANRFILWPICISRERDLREDKVGRFTYLCWHHLGWGEFENLENRDEMNTCQWNISQTFNSDWDVHVVPNARNWRQFHYALALLYQANVRARECRFIPIVLTSHWSDYEHSALLLVNTGEQIYCVRKLDNDKNICSVLYVVMSSFFP